jgi:hypothetical protein
MRQVVPQAEDMAAEPLQAAHQHTCQRAASAFGEINCGIKSGLMA